MTKGSRILLLGVVVTNFALGDDDMDGVPNHLDKCKNTPFFHEVDATGCSSAILKLPQDSFNAFYITFGYSLSHNDDVPKDEERLHSTRMGINYYRDNWSYSLALGYYHDAHNSGLKDTAIKIKCSFDITNQLKFSLGVGVKLPTYDFTGNQTHLVLQSSFIYYHDTKLSFFGGLGYEIVNDKEPNMAIQNISSKYLGSGYFFNDKLYANIAYSHRKSKFSIEHDINLLQSTVFYKLSDNYFMTLSYGHQIFDDDLHNSLDVNFGYSFH